MLKPIFEDIEGFVPTDHCRQVASKYYCDLALRLNPSAGTVLDLGCGVGDSIDYFKFRNPAVAWYGIDIEDSREVRARTRQGDSFYTFDGVNIPFAGESIDLVYSHQVFEHVRRPEELLREVRRVLRPGGYFIGSVSQMEPYHSRSLWNFTPYGFFHLLVEAGLELREVRPSIDAVTLLLRRLLRNPAFFARWWERESPLNRMLSLYGCLTGKSAYDVNRLKLLFCGQFCFLVQKGDPVRQGTTGDSPLPAVP